jgi:ubiquinone/menaquinone biosynthesis C-methylase UbiE
MLHRPKSNRYAPSARVLELATGRGGLSALVQERYHPSRLVVTASDPDQIETARALLSRRFGFLPASIEFRQAGVTTLPFDDRSFDCVFALIMLHHVGVHLSEYCQVNVW